MSPYQKSSRNCEIDCETLGRETCTKWFVIWKTISCLPHEPTRRIDFATLRKQRARHMPIVLKLLAPRTASLFVVFSLLALVANTAHSQDADTKAESPKTEAEAKLAENPKETRRRINEGQGFGIAIENDSRNVGGPGVDQAYSNGIKFSYVYARDQIPRWAPKWLMESNYLRDELAKSKANFGVSLNHQIYTPNNTSERNFIPNDRPYAAWLYAGFSMHVKNDRRSQTLEMSLGVVGPAAQGEAVQNGFHKLIGSESANGWEYQLKNEPAVQFSYQQRLHFFELRNNYGPYFDLIPMFGAGLGNVFIGMHSGMMARVGVNLPDDFGPARPSGGETDSFVSPNASPTDLKSSYYLFAGLRGNAIARNLFLDGSTFENSHKVTKYPFTAETEIGVGLQIMPVSVVWRYVVRSPDFEEMSGFNSFASIGITYFTH